MISLKKNIFMISIIIFIFIIFIPNLNDAKEILIYADKITYDEELPEEFQEVFDSINIEMAEDIFKDD